MTELYSQYESGAMFTAGVLAGSSLGVSGINPIADRLNSVVSEDNVISGTSVEVYGTSSSSTTIPGLIEIATEDEVQTGTDTDRAVVPDTLQVVMPPVGSIVAWLKTLTGVPQTLPVGWVLCNGAVISDGDSPMDGQNTPDLNGGEFLRGAPTTGGTGGYDSHDLSHTHTGPNHRHTGPNHQHTLTLLPGDSIQVGGDYANTGTTGFGGAGNTGYQGTGNTSNELPAVVDNKPLFYNVIWIMRIK